MAEIISGGTFEPKNLTEMKPVYFKCSREWKWLREDSLDLRVNRLTAELFCIEVPSSLWIP